MRTKNRVFITAQLAAVIGVALLINGCAGTQQRKAAPSKPAPAAEPAKPAPEIRGNIGYFPTGVPQGSALKVEKIMPPEAMIGQPFDIVFKVSNLVDVPLQDVVVTDSNPSNFKIESTTPQATVNAGTVVWNLGELAPGQTRELKIRGSALAEGLVGDCATATFRPSVCATVKVVKPAIALSKTMPAQVTQCDPIPVKLVVKNQGSSRLTNVKVTDTLPSGLTTDAGQSAATFDVGTMEPGQSRELAFTAKAARTGKFTNPAKATSAQGVEATAEANVTVVKPVLTITCEAKEKQFAGRPVEFCYTVKNTGDAPSVATVIDADLPAGTKFVSATEGGTATGGKITWNIGTLAAGATKKVCATVTSDVAGTLNFAATTRGTCAEPVTTRCSSLVEGVPGVLLEVVDTVDPIEVGGNTTYIIRVTNQGNVTLTNIKVLAKRDPDSQETVSADGATAATKAGDTITMAPLGTLAAKATAEWRVVVKAAKADNALFTVTMKCDQLREVQETESTNQY